MGYHTGSLINHLVSIRRNDFLEMALHHMVTLYLFTGCYVCNTWEVGAVIVLIHDIPDIGGYAVKLLAETNYKNTTAGAFVIMMGVWFYTRNFIFPQLIY